MVLVGSGLDDSDLLRVQTAVNILREHHLERLEGVDHGGGVFHFIFHRLVRHT